MTSFDIDEKELSASGIDVKNIVAKLDLGIELDLQYLSSELTNSSYEPEQYPSLIFRPNGLSTVLITRTGILLFTGGDSIENLQNTYKCITSELRELGIEDLKSIDDINIVNIISTFNVNSDIDLNHMSILLGLENMEYEPEQFPGIVYRIENGPVVLIFSSGNIIITGATSTEDILEAKTRIKGLIPN